MIFWELGTKVVKPQETEEKEEEEYPEIEVLDFDEHAEL